MALWLFCIYLSPAYSLSMDITESSSEELFEKFLDKVYSLKNIQVASFKILFNLLLQFTYTIIQCIKCY